MRAAHFDQRLFDLAPILGFLGLAGFLKLCGLLRSFGDGLVAVRIAQFAGVLFDFDSFHVPTLSSFEIRG